MPAKPKYTKSICDKLHKKFKDGATIVEVCQELGISRQTYWNWKKEHEEFKEAAEFAEEAAEAYFARIGRKAMLGFPDPEEKEEFVDFQPNMWMFTMKTRFKYRETGDVEGDPNKENTAQPLQINFSVAPPVAEHKVTNSLEQQMEQAERDAAEESEEE